MASRNGSIEKILREKTKNKGGRTAGVPTQKNKLLREMIEGFTDNNFDVFAEKMGEIEKPEMYAKLYLELLSFRMPKLKSIDFKGDIKNSTLEQKLKVLREESLSAIGVELDEMTED